MTDTSSPSYKAKRSIALGKLLQHIEEEGPFTPDEYNRVLAAIRVRGSHPTLATAHN